MNAAVGTTSLVTMSLNLLAAKIRFLTFKFSKHHFTAVGREISKDVTRDLTILIDIDELRGNDELLDLV